MTKDTQIDEWRRGEAERSGDLLKVELFHVEDVLVGVGRVGAHVRLVRLLRRVVQEVVLLDQPLQLRSQSRVCQRVSSVSGGTGGNLRGL